ncbi:MAG: hypothetical protein ACYCUV_13415 [Phycisphaerae bacterium]
MKSHTQRMTACMLASSLIVAQSAMANSFTFDFQHPTGTGSSYADAIPLSTVGSLKDSLGNNIGFTLAADAGSGNRVGSTENATGGLAGLTLNSTGLAFNSANGNATIGISFPTTGSGPLAITARYSSLILSGQLAASGVGIGSITYSSADFAEVVYQTEYPSYLVPTTADAVGTVSSLSSSKFASGNTGSQSIEFYVASPAGGTFNGLFNSGTLAYNDSTQLGQSAEYAFFSMGNPDAASYSGTASGVLTSITFSGDNLATPTEQPVPEPMELSLFTFGLAITVLRRRGNRLVNVSIKI